MISRVQIWSSHLGTGYERILLVPGGVVLLVPGGVVIEFVILLLGNVVAGCKMMHIVFIAVLASLPIRRLVHQNLAATAGKELFSLRAALGNGGARRASRAFKNNRLAVARKFANN